MKGVLRMYQVFSFWCLQQGNTQVFLETERSGLRENWKEIFTLIASTNVSHQKEASCVAHSSVLSLKIRAFIPGYYLYSLLFWWLLVVLIDCDSSWFFYTYTDNRKGKEGLKTLGGFVSLLKGSYLKMVVLLNIKWSTRAVRLLGRRECMTDDTVQRHLLLFHTQ